MNRETVSLTEWLRFLYGDPATVFSSLLRGMIIPSDGCELYVADFSKIEVAVLWWLADNNPGLKILHSGKDPYIYQASANTGKSYEEIERAVEVGEMWAVDARQLGKAQILGGGFGMGWEKFQITGWDMYRLKMSETQSREAIKNYRETNAAVPLLWKAYEQAAIAAIENPGKVYLTNKCKFFVRGKFLWVELPSGRRLSYMKPRLIWRVPTYEITEYEYKGQWFSRGWFDHEARKYKFSNKVINKLPKRTRTVEGAPRQTIEFLGLGLSKKIMQRERTWGGTLTENIVQAVARDLMMTASLNLEKANYRFLLSVHDEGLTERKIGEGSVKEFENIMCKMPSWGDKNLPLQAKAWKGPRYRK